MIAATSTREAFQLCFGSTTCRVEAPVAAARSLRAIFARDIAPAGEADVTVSIDAVDSQWRVSSSRRPHLELVLSAPSLLDVAQSLLRVLEMTLAARTHGTLGKGVVLSLNDDAVVFNGGADGDLFVFVAHLTARNWKIVSTATCFMEPSGRLGGIQQLFSARPAMIPQVPLQYRQAIERSPWYVAHDDIHFYAVEPADAVGGVWNESAMHRASVQISPLTLRKPAIHDVERGDARGPRRVSSARLTLGDPIATADLFENWWQASITGERALSA